MNPLNEFIANKMPSGLITLDRSGRISGHNPASNRIFEGKLKTNTRLRDAIRESEQLDTLVQKCLSTGEIFTRIEFNIPMPNDADKKIGINLSPISNAVGEIEGVVCVLSDLTEIVDLQNQIKLKENFAALGEMSAGIAHEFKNSLATILGYAQLSAAEKDLGTLQAYAREVQKETLTLSMLVADFLNFARPVNTSLQLTDLVELVEKAIIEVKNLRPGNYKVTLHAKAVARIFCDTTLMRQVFINILINAVEALHQERTDSGIVVSMDRMREGVRVIIEDNGRGIPSDVQQKIFIPFFTTKPHGTGLGLSLVQKIVLAHNGRVEVYNGENKGARFVVTLPDQENGHAV